MKSKKIESIADINPAEPRIGVLVVTPTRGNVRIEWCMNRFGFITPLNWHVDTLIQYLGGYCPTSYLLPDAENLCVAQAIAKKAHMITIEEDNLIPPDFFVKMDRYIREKKYPIVSGLYYTKSHPAEPILFRGRGTGAFDDFKIGDKIMCSCAGFGMSMIRYEILKAVWDESEEYIVNGQVTRRVFKLPPSEGTMNGIKTMMTGTTDIEFFRRLKEDKIYEKAGFPKIQKLEYPVLCDTSMFGNHISPDGKQYPLGGIPAKNRVPENYKPRTIL
jgi:hypothetical protein